MEDAVAGIQAAMGAGMPVIAVTTTRQRQDLHQADYIVESIEDLEACDFTKLIGAATS